MKSVTAERATIRRSSIAAAIALAWAIPAAAVTVASPLRFPAQERLAVHRAEVIGERLLDLEPSALAALRNVPLGETVRVDAFPFAPGATGDLLLERFEVASPDARIFVQTGRGETPLHLPAVVHFEGRLDGDLDSRVYVGIPGAFLVATLKTSAGVVYVGPEGPTDGPVQHVLRRSDSPRNAELAPVDWHCDVEELPQAIGNREAEAGERRAPQPRPAAAVSAMSSTTLKDATISVETDQELLAKFAGNASAMSTYVTTLLGQDSVIYQRDVGVHLTVNRIQAWTTTDPYVAGDPRTQLDEVGDWWHANRPKASYPRTSVLYLSGKPVTGGIAWLDVLCMNDFSQGGHWGGAYGVVQISGNYPASLWDLLGSAHEMGHNFGSPHTHCFSPPIDKCYGGEAGCYSGPTVNPGPLGGTIMSYCHLLSGGYGNIDLRFHERCINEQMLPEINSVTCLATIPDTPPVAATFFTVAPCRVADTRDPQGPWGGPAIAANSSRTFPVGGRCGVPATARAVSLNLTVTQPSSAGLLRLHPDGGVTPVASALNYQAGQTRDNNELAGLGSTGGLVVRCEQPSGNAQVIIDVNGYFQ